MKTVWRVTVLVLAALAATPMSASAQTEAIRTKRTEFRIPFTFEKEEYARIGAQEVQLFLSTDRGTTWQHVQSALPTSQKFRYRAVKDGEHWFAVRTLDRDRQLHPQGALTPGLMVVVDTQEPQISMRLSDEPGDHVKVRWQVSDTDLDTASMRVEYNVDGSSDWAPAQFVAGAMGETLLPVPDARKVTVRLGVRDRAGNVGVAERALRIQETINPVPPTVTALPVAAEVTEPEVSGLTLPAPSPLGRQVAPEPPEEANILGPYNLPSTPRVSQRSAVVSAPIAPVSSRVTELPVLAPAPQPTAADMLLPKNPSMSTEPEVDPALARIVNQLQFRLDYALEDLGPSGIGAVEIFITEDGGRKWWRYGEDRDKQSPVILRVPRDGRYGFIIAAKSGVGLGDAPPVPGDEPDVTVVVDRTPPKARFEKVAMDSDGRTLIVNWKAADANPHDHPIRVEYSAKQQGPWLPMDNWQVDDGEMRWDVTSEVPSRIYIRMLLRDAADNVGQIVYPEQVLVDMSRPRARITNVKISRP